jgi:hypothetical protein
MKGKQVTTVVVAAITASLVLAGCASTTPTREVSSGYAIFNVQAGPEIGHARLAEAVKTGLQQSTSRVQVVNGIPPSPLPEKAPRFRLVSPYGANLSALAAASGQAVQMPVCDGAIVTANAADTSMRQYGEGTTFFVCLMPYQGGYALNVYTTFSKASGAFSAATLGATLARTVVGDTSQFIPRTINYIVDSVKATGATVTLVEAYP